jgi:hypothetical protein
MFDSFWAIWVKRWELKNSHGIQTPSCTPATFFKKKNCLHLFLTVRLENYSCRNMIFRATLCCIERERKYFLVQGPWRIDKISMPLMQIVLAQDIHQSICSKIMRTGFWPCGRGKWWSSLIKIRRWENHFQVHLQNKKKWMWWGLVPNHKWLERTPSGPF